jgi:hypothetical protein
MLPAMLAMLGRRDDLGFGSASAPTSGGAVSPRHQSASPCRSTSVLRVCTPLSSVSWSIFWSRRRRSRARRPSNDSAVVSSSSSGRPALRGCRPRALRTSPLGSSSASARRRRGPPTRVPDDVLAHEDLALLSVCGDACGDVDRPSIEIAVLVNDWPRVDADVGAREVRLRNTVAKLEPTLDGSDRSAGRCPQSTSPFARCTATLRPQRESQAASASLRRPRRLTPPSDGYIR